MKKYFDDPNSKATALVGLTFTLLFVVVVVSLQAYFGRVQREEFDAKLEKSPPPARVGLAEEQLRQIREYRWVDRQAGVVAIPIERAMELVVQDLADAGGES